MAELPELKVVVLTADQIGSRKGGDKVPGALAALKTIHLGTGSRAFARNAGDEIQGLLTDSAAAVTVIETLSRIGDWRIGVGIAAVGLPLPRDVRAATGPAFVAAREAINSAHSAPQDLRVAGDDTAAVADLEAALWLLRLVWRRRTAAGWEAVAAAANGTQQQQIAQDLGITPSAVSQRLRASGYAEAAAGVRLAVELLDRARGIPPVGASR